MIRDYSKLTREELEKALNDTTDKLEILMDNMPGGVFIYSADNGKFEYISKGVLSIFHCSEEEFRDRFYNNFELMIDKDDRQKVKDSIENQLNFFDSVELTYRVNDSIGISPTWIYHKAKLFKKDDGSCQFYTVITDITEEKLVQESLNDMTRHLYDKVERDDMTGLFNKVTMEKEIEAYLSSNKTTLSAVLMIDTDNFKSINDTFGHAYGDEIIKYVAASIDSNFRSTDYKARMGGDEFMVFMQNTNKASVEARAKMLNDKIRRDCTQDGKTVHVSCSIGIAYSPKDGTNYRELFTSADAALYQAKEAGKDCYRTA